MPKKKAYKIRKITWDKSPAYMSMKNNEGYTASAGQLEVGQVYSEKSRKGPKWKAATCLPGVRIGHGHEWHLTRGEAMEMVELAWQQWLKRFTKKINYEKEITTR